MSRGINVYPLCSAESLLIFLVHSLCAAPYEGGVWKVRVDLPDKYPFKSPSIGRSPIFTCSVVFVWFCLVLLFLLLFMYTVLIFTLLFQDS